MDCTGRYPFHLGYHHYHHQGLLHLLCRRNQNREDLGCRRHYRHHPQLRLCIRPHRSLWTNSKSNQIRHLRIYQGAWIFHPHRDPFLGPLVAWVELSFWGLRQNWPNHNHLSHFLHDNSSPLPTILHPNWGCVGLH